MFNGEMFNYVLGLFNHQPGINVSEIISCPNCGQKNRMPQSKSSKAICAKCWTRLNVHTETFQPTPTPQNPSHPEPSNNSNAKCKKFSLWLVCILVIIGWSTWWVVNQNTNKNPKITTTKKHETSNTVPIYHEEPMPLNGALQIYTNSERIAPLEIITSNGSNYLVKLVSTYSQQPIMTVFVRGGNTISIQVPLGTYEIKYASGKKWYGYEHIFGTETGYSKADKTFTFENTGYKISGYTITLYSVHNGNLRTSKISQSEF